MTVGTEQLQVAQPIVDPATIDVMKRHAEGLSAPTGDAAPLTPVLLDSLRQQALLQVGAICLPTAIYEKLLDWHLPRTRFDSTSLNGGMPAAEREPEALSTCPD